MALDYAQILEGFARALSISTTQGGPGQPVNAALAPLEFPAVPITEIAQGAIDIGWVSQSVKFSEVLDAAPPSPPPAGLPSLPLNIPATQPVDPEMGTDGVINRLSGTLPIPLKYEAPVGLQVTWRVTTDQAGQLEPKQPGNAGAGEPWCLPLTPLDVPAPAFLFSVRASHLQVGPPPTTRWYLWARVKLTLPVGNTKFEKELGPIPVDVPDIQIPTVLACFNHHSFAPMGGDQPGFVLAVVPNGSPLGSAEALNSALETADRALSTVRTTLDTLGFAAAFAGLAPIAGLVSTLSSAMRAQPHARFAQADWLADLSQFEFVPGTPFGRLTAEDSIGSLILVGPPGQGVELFNLRGTAPDHGFLEVRAGEAGFTLVHGLGEVPPPTDPPNQAAGVITATDYSFTNHISSLRFGLPARRDRLNVNETLVMGQRLFSALGNHALVYRTDGHLAVLSPGKVAWTSPAPAPGARGRLILQGDGNLVLYEEDTAVWSPNAYNYPGAAGAHLVMQNDGNLVLYSETGDVQWAMA